VGEPVRPFRVGQPEPSLAGIAATRGWKTIIAEVRWKVGMDTQRVIREYVQGLFQGGDLELVELADDAPLMSTSLLDSIATLKLVAFLERTFSIEISRAEATEGNFESILRITTLVEKKLGSR
jgi:acyl carrier protein